MPDESHEMNTIVDIERTKESIFYTPNGDIHIIHEITLGDIVTILILSILLILMIIQQIRR